MKFPRHFTTRRTFLQSSLATTLLAYSHPILAFPQSPQPDAAPQNLLSNTFNPLASALLPPGTWHPYPKAGDPAWHALPEPVRATLITRADLVNSTPWPAMLATDELEFARNGNRSRFETISFGRRNRLGDLVLAESLTNSGKYLDQIANGLWLICEESFWGVPAHLGAQKVGVGLADVSEPIIELFGAETSAIVAWATYLLEPQLNSISPRIVERIHLEAKRRILDPYFTRTDFSWMGLNGKPHHLNNWNPWINSNILTANLLLERDPLRRQAIVTKVCASTDQFLADYSPDAGCEEGPGYWARSAASFFDCCWTLVSGHANQGDAVLHHPFTRAMGQYICNVHIAGNYFVNYGDAHPHDAPPPDLTYRFGKATNDSMLAQFGAFEARTRGTSASGTALSDAIVANRGSVASLSRALATVLTSSEIASAPAADALPRDAWYPHLGLMTARQTAGSADGFYLASQAASNGRSHGHNDSGSPIIFHNGKPIFIDVGPEAYTAKTFSKDRYTLWTMQSAFHNLPTINGVMQHEGDAYRASDLQYQSTDEAVTFRANLATAYPTQAGAQRWLRTLTLDRTKSQVTLTDDFRLTQPSPVILNFMTATQPTLQPTGIQIAGVLLAFDPHQLIPSIQTIPITDEALQRSWGKTVYRLQLTASIPATQATWHLTLTSA